jgi:hypothetical protein
VSYRELSPHKIMPMLGVHAHGWTSHDFQLSLALRGGINVSAKTESESLFERFCTDLHIPLTPIPCDTSQTPDYELRLGTSKVIAEIKQLDLNVADKKKWGEARSSGAIAAWCGTEERWARKIKKANKQLKARCQSDIPGIAVCFDNGTFGGTDDTDIKEAMYGKETVTISRSGFEVIAVTPIHAGEGGRLTATANTTISAIGVLQNRGSKCTLALYHNHFAANRIDPDWFRHERFIHYILSDDVYEWTRI